MDYKELIYRLRYNRVCSDDIAEAAIAIETLLEERDAAAEELRGICWCCKHGKPFETPGAISRMTTCKYMEEFGMLACTGHAAECTHWEWRGPQRQKSY